MFFVRNTGVLIMRRCRRSHRYRGPYRGEKRGIGGKIFILLLILAALFIFLEMELAPVMRSLTENEAKRTAVDSINSMVQEELQSGQINYDDLVNIERSDSGQILAITTNMPEINLLKSKISTAINQKLGHDHIEVGVPVGTLTGNDLLHGRGPDVPLMVTLAGNVDTDFKSSFESAGINQTRHQIYLEIHTSIYSFIPGINTTTDITTNVEIAETVIVGEVPDMYAQLTPGMLQNSIQQ